MDFQDAWIANFVIHFICSPYFAPFPLLREGMLTLICFQYVAYILENILMETNDELQEFWVIHFLK